MKWDERGHDKDPAPHVRVVGDSLVRLPREGRLRGEVKHLYGSRWAEPHPESV